jgi:subtilisin-like proprotein convertase family protein
LSYTRGTFGRRGERKRFLIMGRLTIHVALLMLFAFCLLGPALAVEYSSTDTPRALVGDSNTHSELTIASTDTISDLNVVINITYPVVGELDIRLTDPNGLECYMTYGPGMSGANMTNTVFDDEASASIWDGTAPFTGFFLPYHNLSRYNRKSMVGTWKMDVHAYGYVGTLNSWALVFNDTDTPSVSITDVSQTLLWPPTNKLVPVVVSGTVSDSVGIFSAWIEVDDEYDQLDGTIPVSLDADGNFSQELSLAAFRKGCDRNGRAYSITLHAVDFAGNEAVSDPVTVLVPHDQRKPK